MSLAQPKFPPEFDPADRAQFRPEADRFAYATSPARTLQQRLEFQSAGATAEHYDKWPLGQRVALMLAASIALWAALLSGMAQVYHAIA